jgi:hypothetical protein
MSDFTFLDHVDIVSLILIHKLENAFGKNNSFDLVSQFTYERIHNSYFAQFNVSKKKENNAYADESIQWTSMLYYWLIILFVLNEHALCECFLSISMCTNCYFAIFGFPFFNYLIVCFFVEEVKMRLLIKNSFFCYKSALLFNALAESLDQ